MNSREGFTGPVNIGNPGELTMLELVIKLEGSSSKIVYKELPQDDPMQRRPMIDLAEKELGWRPTTDLEEGLRRTIEYLRGQLRIC